MSVLLNEVPMNSISVDYSLFHIVLTQFDEHKDQVAVEQILRVVFLDVERPSPALEKLKRQLAEAEAELEARKKPSEDTGPKFIGEGLVIDEWKERRERYLARQQVEGERDPIMRSQLKIRTWAESLQVARPQYTPNKPQLNAAPVSVGTPYPDKTIISISRRQKTHKTSVPAN
ncbi:Vesicle-associated protein 4-1 [Sesamum angolense]|uniref:Vesicle-associated protein 4-1 n=1 Tax=Sesamum angolense TaxID=2727404 RepID=A0AAE1WTT5_9LAMI|nr:Vesicle-associated protein 4-1 [Sesamum angolense]